MSLTNPPIPVGKDDLRKIKRPGSKVERLLRGHSVIYWSAERIALSLFWPFLFLPWLLMSTRFIIVNILSQVQGGLAKEELEKCIWDNVKASVFLILGGLVLALILAHMSVELIGVTVWAFLAYVLAGSMPIVWLGSKRYINQFLSAYANEPKWRMRLWVLGVSFLSGFWLGYLGWFLWHVPLF